MVDDGSSDGTSHQAFKHVRQYGIDTVRVLRLPRNHGKVLYTMIFRGTPRGALWVHDQPQEMRFNGGPWHSIL